MIFTSAMIATNSNTRSISSMARHLLWLVSLVLAGSSTSRSCQAQSNIMSWTRDSSSRQGTTNDNGDKQPILIDQNTTWTTSRLVATKIIIYPDTQLFIRGTPSNKIVLTYPYDCRDSSIYQSGLNTSLGFALHQGASLILEHVEMAGTCHDQYGPVAAYYISSDDTSR